MEVVAETGDYGWFYRMHIQLIHIEDLPCTKCGESNKFKLEVDHVVARCNGGKHSRDNLQVLCVTCHSVKTIRDRAIYVQTQKTQGQRLSINC